MINSRASAAAVGAQALGGAAADAAENRDIGRLDDRVTDDLLGREGIYRENSVRVTVPDDSQVCGEDQALDPPAVDDNAGGRVSGLGNPQDLMTQGAGNVRGVLFHGNLLSVWNPPP